MKRSRIRMMSSQCVLFGLPALVLALGGCGSGSQSDTASNGGTKEPIFAISTLVFAPDFSTWTEYVRLAPSLDAAAKVDDSKSIEWSASMPLHGQEGADEFFLVAGDKGEITKYTVAADGRAEAGEAVSFTAYSVTKFGVPPVVIASKTRAYVLDEFTYQGFVWDPSTMTIVSRVDLSSQFQNKEGDKSYWTQFQYSPTKLGSKYYIAFNYWDPAAFEGPPRSGMLIIDPDKDTFSVVHHPTCGGMINTVTGQDGYLYDATFGGYAATHRVGVPGATAPCLTRFDPKTDTFDSTFNVALTDVAGGKTAGGIVENSGTLVYVKVLNEDLLPDKTSKSALAISSAPAWETYLLDLANPTAMTRVETPALSSEFYVSRAGGHAFTSQMDWTTGKCNLLDMSTNPPSQGVTTTGWINKVVRVR